MEQNTINGHVLILDDDQNIQSALSAALTAHGYRVSSFQRAKDALDALQTSNSESAPIDIIVTDVRIPEMDGLTFITNAKKIRPEIPIVVMTGFDCLETAIQAIRLGAFDFLKKPFTMIELLHSVDRALNHHQIVNENKVLSAAISNKWKFDQIVGKSQKMQNVFDLIKRVANTAATVLITGESGTGKEMIARAIHENGSQAGKPFVAINCAAIPEGLLESELFGHARGSFTGAHQARKGLFQEANGGTIFLDEIGDMSMALQAKLLRVLQDKQVKPVGENAYKKIDVRILAATNRSLKAAIKNGEFREDLYYRLNVISIAVPPLRERREDIILLAQHFLQKYSAIHHGTVKRISKDAMARLMSDQWPGNIRELENLIERSVVICSGQELQQKDLVQDVAEAGLEAVVDGFQKPDNSEYMSLEEMEMRYIAFILDKSNGKKEAASRILKIDRTTLHRRMVGHSQTLESPPA